MSANTFQFKQFSIQQDQCSMKINTDGVLLGAWAHTRDASSILDIGTGTGVIAIMCAQRNQNAQVIGIEIEKKSADQARENMNNSPWSERLSLINDAIQNFTRESHEKYDLIVCNPPFFSGGTFSMNQDRNNVRHTIKLPNGDLLRCAKSLLSKEGRFSVVLPYLEGLRFKELAETYGLYGTKITNVYGRIGKKVERVLLEFSHNKSAQLIEDELVLQIAGRADFSDEYVALTRNFYLKMP